jgi:hypothetical protein
MSLISSYLLFGFKNGNDIIIQQSWMCRAEHLRENNLRLFHVYSPFGRIFAPRVFTLWVNIPSALREDPESPHFNYKILIFMIVLYCFVLEPSLEGTNKYSFLNIPLIS